MTARTIVPAVLLVLVFAVACTASAPGAPATATAPGAASPVAQGGTCVIRIGSFGPLSGVSTDLGNGVVNAVQMAIDEANEKGGVTLKDGRQCTFELVKGDDEATPEKALAVVRRMIEEDKVDGIVGGVVSATILAVIDTIEKAGVPYINASGASLKIPQTIAENKYRFIFSASPDTDQRGGGAAELIHKLLNASTVAFVNEGGDAGRSDAAVQKAYYAANAPDIELVAEEYVEASTTDFSAIFGKLRQNEPDVIYSETFGAAVIAFGQQYCEQGLTAQPVLGFAPADYATQVGPECANGTIVMEVWSPRAPLTDLTLPFATAYQERFGIPPGYWAAQAYDGALMMIEGFRQAGTLDKTAVATALEQVRITGVRGELFFLPVDQGHKTSTSLVFSQIVDGQPKVVWPAEAAEISYTPYAELHP